MLSHFKSFSSYSLFTSFPLPQFHDTYGTALANVMTALSLGIRTIDTSVAGLGGCPYSPGATGNVATEDVLFALRESPYTVEGDVDMEQVALVGQWISEQLGRENTSRAGKAILGKLKKKKCEDVNG
jgi:hydroxymethylglutaryl-CoA lyase